MLVRRIVLLIGDKSVRCGYVYGEERGQGEGEGQCRTIAVQETDSSYTV